MARRRDHALDAAGVSVGPGVVGDARLEVAGLADVDDLARRIDHAVDARQRPQIVGDHLRPGIRGAASVASACPGGASDVLPLDMCRR